MTWFRVDDRFDEHAKVESLEGDANAWARAISVWTMVGVHCSRNSTDGHISTARLKRLTPFGARAEAIAEDLVRAGLFEKTDTGYLMHDFLDWNPSADDVEKDRELARIRQIRSRDKRRTAALNALAGGPRDITHDEPPNVTPHVTRDSMRDVPRESQSESRHPGPTRPDPTHKDLVVVVRGRARELLEGGDPVERSVSNGELDAAFVDLCGKPLGKWAVRYSELSPFSPYELKCAWLAMQQSCAGGGSKPNPGLYLTKLEEVRRKPAERKSSPTFNGSRGYHPGSEHPVIGDVKL